MLALASLLLLQGAEALLPLVVEGNKFYQLQPDYTQPPVPFTIRGVDYQPGGSSGFSLEDSTDVLTEVDACARDAFLLNKLGANAIRVYSVSPWLNHDVCMSLFNNAGIYVLLDVNTPDNSINRADPASSYTTSYLNNVFGLVDAFKKYPNLMGFIAGNEIINDGASASIDPVYIRAVIRDVKQYINEWSNRTIPVGYAAADNLEYRDITFEYLQCNEPFTNSTTPDSLSRADFFGINSYTWCSGVNDYASSGYDEIAKKYNSTSIPILFTEYGCNAKRPRSFAEVDGGVYGPLSDFVSGGFVYEYSNEVSNYGLVDIDEEGNASLLQDYVNLQTAFAKIPNATVTATAAASTVTAPQCSAKAPAATNSFDWDFSLPPSPGSSLIKSNGGNNNVGHIVNIASPTCNATILDVSSSQITPTLTFDSKFTINYQTNVPLSILNKPVPGSTSMTTSALFTPTDTAALYGKDNSASSASGSASGNSTTGNSSSSATSSTQKKNNANRNVASTLVLLGGVAAVVALM